MSKLRQAESHSDIDSSGTDNNYLQKHHERPHLTNLFLPSKNISKKVLKNQIMKCLIILCHNSQVFLNKFL